MATLIWHPQRIVFHGVPLDAFVARSTDSEFLDKEKKALEKLPKDEILVRRSLPLIVGEVIGHTPKGKPMYRTTIQEDELWRILGGVGSFDSIRFAKAVFNAPADEYFREGVGSLEQIIAMLSEAFAEGDFRLEYVNPAMLLFTLTTVGATVGRRQYALLDRLKDRFFTTDATGKHMKSVHSSSPDSFVIGAV